MTQTKSRHNQLISHNKNLTVGKISKEGERVFYSKNPKNISNLDIYLLREFVKLLPKNGIIEIYQNDNLENLNGAVILKHKQIVFCGMCVIKRTIGVVNRSKKCKYCGIDIKNKYSYCSLYCEEHDSIKFNY